MPRALRAAAVAILFGLARDAHANPLLLPPPLPGTPPAVLLTLAVVGVIAFGALFAIHRGKPKDDRRRRIASIGLVACLLVVPIALLMMQDARDARERMIKSQGTI